MLIQEKYFYNERMSVSKMAKVVILGGNARSGKSTLSYKLIKEGYNRISFDNIYDAIEDGLNIKMDECSHEQKFSFFENIVDKAIEEAEIEGINTVIDMYDFLPADINNLKNKNKVKVYFLAYPNCSLEEIKFNVIHYAKPTDWIAQVDEEYLNSCAKRFYERNELLVNECDKYGLKLIDTKSKEDRDIVLNQLLNEIID